MKNKKYVEELFSKIHQICCIEYENSIESGDRKRSIKFLIPMLKVLSDFGYSDSTNLYASLLLEKSDENFVEAVDLYLKAIDQGSYSAMYNLYISYAQIGDNVNAFKYYKMAKEHNELDSEEEFLGYKN